MNPNGMPDRDIERELRARVGIMRELGILEWDGIKLGPAPAVVESVAQKVKTKEELKREFDATLFASSEGVDALDE